MTPNDTLAIFNLTEKVLWTDIDRWNYTNPSFPQAPEYTIYTGLSLGDTFICFLCLTGLHIVCITIIKIGHGSLTLFHQIYIKKLETNGNAGNDVGGET